MAGGRSQSEPGYEPLGDGTERLVVFFFSSRRRHTRCGRDWSSDVCSSDLSWQQTQFVVGDVNVAVRNGDVDVADEELRLLPGAQKGAVERVPARVQPAAVEAIADDFSFDRLRSEERRVGTEGRTRGSTDIA